MTYYRYTKSSTDPMSSWGHAMFADNDLTSEHYGDYVWSFDGKKATNIESLYPIIAEKWENEETREGAIMNDISDEYDLTTEDVIALVNPEDIVDSAGAYDRNLGLWLYEMVLEPLGIMAITTNDGAIVFDADLIDRCEDLDN